MGCKSSKSPAEEPAGATVSVYQMPASQNACGPVLLALELGVGKPEPCNLMEGEHKKPEFLAINPYGQIPSMKDGDLSIGESNAILRYLSIKYGKGQQWYPYGTDAEQCGRIDFALDAFSNVYKAHMPIVYQVFGFAGAPENQAEANKAYVDAINKWLEVHVKDQMFVGGNVPSIADYKAAPFFYSAKQPVMKEKLGFDAPERMLKYCDDFMAAVSSSVFMQDAGGYSIKEFSSSKSDNKSASQDAAPGSKKAVYSDVPAKKQDAKFQVYQMPMSQNACGPTILAMANGGEPVPLDLMAGAHKQPDYIAIHPYGQIPGLKHGEFSLGESNAILRYIALSKGLDAYPTKDPAKCAKIDFAIDAFSNVYKAHMPIVYQVFGFAGAPEDQPKANKEYADAINTWLDTHAKDQKFVGGDTPSIADFKAAPFFFSAIQPAMKKKVDFDPPARANKYCEDFLAAVPEAKFMQEAGGASIKEYAASKEA